MQWTGRRNLHTQMRVADHRDAQSTLYIPHYSISHLSTTPSTQRWPRTLAHIFQALSSGRQKNIPLPSHGHNPFCFCEISITTTRGRVAQLPSATKLWGVESESPRGYAFGQQKWRGFCDVSLCLCHNGSLWKAFARHARYFIPISQYQRRYRTLIVSTSWLPTSMAHGPQGRGFPLGVSVGMLTVPHSFPPRGYTLNRYKHGVEHLFSFHLVCNFPRKVLFLRLTMR